VYVLDTNQGAIIKRIEKSDDEDSILIVSDNEKYSPFTLHLSQVRSIALVIGLIRLE
ncbi:S24 family peptidase, partial [Vibrio parahaemolyticus]|uniref:S24 family peptidase n=1 Tax=Vibrio parahaemolyticus TaxID=670 RepID=UPI0034D61626